VVKKKVKTTFKDLRSFALGELQWSLDRYLHSTIYEYNQAAKGYWRMWEWEMWRTREVVYEIIRASQFYNNEDKPKNKSDVYKLSIDEIEVKKVVKKKPEITEEDLKIFQQLQFNKK